MLPERGSRLDANARLLLAAALGLAILLVSGLLLGQELPAGTRFDASAAIEQSQRVIGNAVGDYTLLDTDGQPVALASYRGKPLVISQAADPASDRRISVELKATVMK